MKGSRAMPPSLKRSPASKTNTPVVDDIRYNDVLIWNPGDVSGKTAHPYYRKHRPVPFAAPSLSEKPKKRLSMRTPQAKVRKML